MSATAKSTKKNNTIWYLAGGAILLYLLTRSQTQQPSIMDGGGGATPSIISLGGSDKSAQPFTIDLGSILDAVGLKPPESVEIKVPQLIPDIKAILPEGTSTTIDPKTGFTQILPYEGYEKPPDWTVLFPPAAGFIEIVNGIKAIFGGTPDISTLPKTGQADVVSPLTLQREGETWYYNPELNVYQREPDLQVLQRYQEPPVGTPGLWQRRYPETNLDSYYGVSAAADATVKALDNVPETTPTPQTNTISEYKYLPGRWGQASLDAAKAGKTLATY